MARSLLLLTVSTLALVATATHAQNYVPPENYSGPNVVIDFGALDQANGSADRWVVAPVEQEQLAPPAPPVKLHPPIVRKAMRMTPYVPAQQQAPVQPQMMPDSQPMTADAPPLSPQHEQALAPAPVAQPTAPRPMPQPPMQHAAAPAPVMAQEPHPMAPMPAAPLPPPTQFAARDMLDSAPPAPPVTKPTPAPAPMAAPKPTPVPPAKPSAPTVASSGFATKTGSMLAQARKNSSEKADRVNLASISDGPPLPMRSQAPIATSKPVTAAVAKPTLAADKPAPVKPAPIAKPPAIEEDDMAPPPSAKPSTAALPPTAALKDLEKTDNSAMHDVIQQATKDEPVKTAVAKEADKPMQIASLPPTVAARNLDNETKPASDSLNAEHVSLMFSKDAGTLDQAAKKDLDKIIKALKANSSSRAQIRAYASGTPETSGQARRLSLTRALAARSYIVDQDIPATRLDIRALGNGQGSVEKPAGGNMDRVDISLVK